MKPKAEPKSLYFVGIKGVAMAGLAIMAKELGYNVTGSDEATVFPTDQLLRDHGIEFHNGYDASHLKQKPDLVVVSAAYGLQNDEVRAAKAGRITIIPQSEMLAKIMEKFESVGVAGVHGKTTTTSMLAFIFKQAGFSPSYAIGTSSVPGLDGNSHIGDGKYFVVEADEYKKSDLNYQPKFLDLPLKHVIITSIELDHPDIYSTAEQVYSVFYQLTSKIPRGGTIVACTDWPLVKRLATRLVDRTLLTYGFEPGAAYQIYDVTIGDKTVFSIKDGETPIGPVTISLPGKHNILNATAAILMATKLGVSTDAAIRAMASFEGPKRRFELLGKYNGAEIYDDYAHHPTAITYLIEAAKKRFPQKNIIVVFQPHTYSRTGKLLKEFAAALQAADKLILLNIWASAREKSGYVTIQDLIREVRILKPDVEYRSSLAEAAAYLKGSVSASDVVLLVGAGDVYQIFDLLGEGSN